MLRRAAAYHEASHAIVAMSLGLQVSWARITDRSGQVAISAPRNEREDLLVLLAGTIGQHRAAPGTPLGRSESIAIAALDPQLAACWRAQAEAMVDRHWNEIENVAARLLAAGRLEADEIYSACSGVKAAWCR